MFVSLNDQKINYAGRIDWKEKEQPIFIFPATSMEFNFYGRSAKLKIKNHGIDWINYAGAVVDGIEKKWELPREGEIILDLVDEPKERKHKILFFKRMDACHEMQLCSLELSEGSKMLEPNPIPKRRIEFYGDSVTAGEVSEAIEYAGKQDPVHHGQYSNSYGSYSWMTARKLHAKIHNIAQGGIPLLNGTGWVDPPVYIGMEYMWDKLHYRERHGEAVEWDFSQYTPQLVVIAIGQNDSNPYDVMKKEPKGVKARQWKEKYKEFVLNIRKKYPRAVIILATTILEHDENWDIAIDEVCNEINDDRIRHFLYSRNGCGTPGHIRIQEAEEMSDELVAYIEQLDIPVWE